jgi:hypothetical protein
MKSTTLDPVIFWLLKALKPSYASAFMLEARPYIPETLLVSQKNLFLNFMVSTAFIRRRGIRFARVQTMWLV